MSRLCRFLAVVLLSLLVPNHATAGVVFGILGIQISDEAETSAESTITSQGHTATVLSDLSGTTLNGIDVLWVLNADATQPSELTTTYKSEISSFVTNGGVFLYHDQVVNDADNSLPGGGSIAFARDTTSGQNDINVLGSTTQVTSGGPGGTIDNSTLDNGNASSHGYATVNTLPAGATAILARTDSSQVVDFQYAFGSGFVYYSTIPLDFHLEDINTNNFKDIYAKNVVAHAAFLAQQSGSAVPEPTSIALLGICLSGVAVRALRKRMGHKR